MIVLRITLLGIVLAVSLFLIDEIAFLVLRQRIVITLFYCDTTCCCFDFPLSLSLSSSLMMLCVFLLTSFIDISLLFP